MHRFFVGGQCTVGEEVALPPDEARHAGLVLRLTPGEAVELSDGQGLYAATLTAVDGREARGLVSALLPDREPRVRVTLFQGLTKGDKFDGIVRKCTELGVHAVQPLEMARCVQRSNFKRAEAQRERWQRIAREAAKQCGRALTPAVYPPLRMGDPALDGRWGEQQLLIAPWEEAGRGSLRDALGSAAKGAGPLRAGLVIGPEGGVTEGEIAQLRALGARVVTLGPRVLRAETAGMAALAVIMALCGEME